MLKKFLLSHMRTQMRLPRVSEAYGLVLLILLMALNPAQAEILDGTRGGNPNFFFLPPIVESPTTHPEYNLFQFDPNQSPVVAIYPPWGSPIVFTMAGGPDSETVRMDESEQQYVVNWHTSRFDLREFSKYRIKVIVGWRELGHADVVVVGSPKEFERVDTSQYIPLLNGRTLPIKFRIEEGAVKVKTRHGIVFTRGSPIDLPLVLDNGIRVGTVTAVYESYYGDRVHVTYRTDNGWSLVETHMHTTKTLGEMPVTSSGCPILENFEFKKVHEPGTTEYTYTKN